VLYSKRMLMIEYSSLSKSNPFFLLYVGALSIRTSLSRMLPGCLFDSANFRCYEKCRKRVQFLRLCYALYIGIFLEVVDLRTKNKSKSKRCKFVRLHVGQDRRYNTLVEWAVRIRNSSQEKYAHHM
jgi:hypothetical protein